MKPLLNKIALITGAGRGIGKATAIHLAELGADIILHYAVNDQSAFETQSLLENHGVNVYLIKSDLSKSSNIETLFNEVDTILAGKNLDILINNAGILHRFDIEHITENQYDELFKINVKAPFFMIKFAISRMKNKGRIINLSSYLSQRPKYNYGAYSMTKAALDNLTKSMASELGIRGITINSVAPGSVDTDMNKDRFINEKVKQAAANSAALKRIGTPLDIAKVIGFLASEESAWITGQYIEVSGGMDLVK